jgi:hypothetical protein
MKDLVVRRGWWPKMNQDIRKFVESCANCQIAQRQRPTQEREYAQLPTPRTIQPFQRWGIDLIGRLPRSKDGNEYIITAIDYATGWPIAKAIKRATEDEIADFIFHEIYMHYSASQEIFTNEGKNLWGGAVQRYLEKIKTIHKGTSPYHPRTNGKVESLNGLIGSMITKYLLGKPTKLWVSRKSSSTSALSNNLLQMDAVDAVGAGGGEMYLLPWEKAEFRRGRLWVT